ncbi:hypothetical protein NXC24_PB00433 (plasmid) [Rhizobium sp. NXC24]|nr:hypothetical protein NXC24_PB00433 [Rhizobium sp. NXC24]
MIERQINSMTAQDADKPALADACRIIDLNVYRLRRVDEEVLTAVQTVLDTALHNRVKRV